MTALENLKGFFKKNIEAENQKAPTETQSVQQRRTQISFGKMETQTYEDWGFDMSKKQKGNEKAFSGCWALVREYYTKKERGDIEKQEQEIKKAKAEVEKRETEKHQKEKIIEGIKTKIDNLKQKIDELKKDIFRIGENPSIVQKDGSSKVSLIIGLVILTGITIYLFIFYSSAIYSALIKNFTINDDVLESIFDGEAIPKAFKEKGIGGLLFVTGIPFVFLGLGYLIHKFQESKDKNNYLKVAFLIVGTFVFDCILAFEILNRIYVIQQQSSFKDMPDYNLGMAIGDIMFWLIIFAGFVSYIIWGFVFDFTMDSYNKLDVVKRAIKSKESEIKLLEDDIEKHNKEIEETQSHINNLEIEMIPFEKIINGEVFVLNWSRFYQCINEFTNGWTEWMTANRFEKHMIDEIHLINELLTKQHKKEVSGEREEQNKLQK